MNWLAKINFTRVILGFGPYRSALLALAVLFICLFCGYRFGNYYHGYQVKTLAEQKQRLDLLYQQNSDQSRRIHTLEVELEVERLANISALENLKKIETDHYQIKKELAFYQKVMAPEKQADGLVIDDFVITASESPEHYRFEVTLVQQQVRKRYAKGYVQISFVGSLADKPSKLALSELSSLTKKQLTFSFQYFQLIAGEFTLPKNFLPEKVRVSVILPKGKWQKYHRLDKNYDWPLELPRKTMGKIKPKSDNDLVLEKLTDTTTTVLDNSRS